MATDGQWVVREGDAQVLRELGRRQLEIAHSEESLQRKRRWLSHNALRGGGAMVLAEIGGLIQSGEFRLDGQLRCQEDWARQIEQSLRWTIYQHEQVKDDSVVEPWINVGWRVQASDYGVTANYHHGSTDGHMGSYKWDAPIQDLRRDFEKLRPRTFSVDREGTLAWKAHLAQVFDGVLPVRIRGSFWWTMGLTWTAISLVGLESLMLFMVDDPDGLHRLMAFLRDDHLAFAQWLEREGLLTLNNENDYIGSGSTGYSSELPARDLTTEQTARMKDLWVLSESQETVGVSPAMFAEFIFPYQQTVAEQFGLSYYGCCEPVHNRWHVVRQLRNLRKVSVSPWCDEASMAEALGGKYVYCRKPNPALVSTERFDEDAIRQDLRNTLRVARQCHLELVMKDVHTLSAQPWRLGRWVELAREACRRAME